MRKHLYWVLFLFACFAARLSAQTAQAPSESKSDENCILQGKVINTVTGEPVKKARLILRRYSAPQPSTSQTPAASYTTTSDEDGSFAMKNLPPGDYRLSAQRNGFVDAQYGAKRISGNGATLTLDKGQRLAGIEFKVTPHSVIAGRVQDETGEPVARATVSAIQYRYQYIQGRKQASSIGSATTNDLGEYRIFGLRPGRYLLVARDAATLSGGTPPEDRSAEPGSGEDYVPTFYPGTANAQSAVQVEAAAGAQVLGANLTLAKARMVRVRGRLVNQTDAPDGRRSIVLLPREPMGYPNILSPSMGADGQFEFAKLVPGSYSLFATVTPAQQPLSLYSLSYTTHLNLEVGATDIENLVLTVRPGADVSGSVSVDGTSKLKLAGIRVNLRPAEPVGLTVGQFPNAVVGEDGSFALRNAGGEPQVVIVSGLPAGAYVKSIRMGDEDALEDPLDLKGGAAGKLKIVLGENAGEVAGAVVDDGQKPVAGATVVLIPDSEKRRRRQEFYRTAVSDKSGRYSISGVDPGSYRIYAWDDVETGAWMDAEFLEPFKSKGKELQVKEGRRENLDLGVLAVSD